MQVSLTVLIGVVMVILIGHSLIRSMRLLVQEQYGQMLIGALYTTIALLVLSYFSMLVNS